MIENIATYTPHIKGLQNLYSRVRSSPAPYPVSTDYGVDQPHQLAFDFDGYPPGYTVFATYTGPGPDGQLRMLADVACWECRMRFTVRLSEIQRGRGKFCSVACSNRYRPPVKFNPRDQFGEKNPNWRGGFKAIAHVRKWKASNREKFRAHRIVYNAIRSGRLARPGKCSSCGIACKPDAHHKDYSKPLDVIWLCRSCHVRISRRCA